MNKREQLQESLTKLVGMTDIPASAVSELTQVVSLVADVQKESDDTIKEQSNKITTLSTAYTDLAIHGKVTSAEQPKGDDKPEPPNLDDIGAEIITKRK